MFHYEIRNYFNFIVEFFSYSGPFVHTEKNESAFHYTQNFLTRKRHKFWMVLKFIEVFFKLLNFYLKRFQPRQALRFSVVSGCWIGFPKHRAQLDTNLLNYSRKETFTQLNNFQLHKFNFNIKLFIMCNKNMEILWRKRRSSNNILQQRILVNPKMQQKRM